MNHLIPSQELENKITALFIKAGSAPAEAQQVAANLVMANLSGHDSHGVGMAPRYVDAILEGNLSPNTGVAVKVDTGMLLGLDGQHGFGQVVGVQAMNMAFERVTQHGACVMSLSSAHHLGRIGHMAEMAVAKGWVSLHFVSVFSRPVVAPFGGGRWSFWHQSLLYWHSIGIWRQRTRALCSGLCHQPCGARQDACCTQ